MRRPVSAFLAAPVRLRILSDAAPRVTLSNHSAETAESCTFAYNFSTNIFVLTSRCAEICTQAAKLQAYCVPRFDPETPLNGNQGRFRIVYFSNCEHFVNFMEIKKFFMISFYHKISKDIRLHSK